MNEPKEKHELNTDDQLAIDRLVDGELGDEQRRELLASLDYCKDGWRRLALAFVEAQTWFKDFGDVLESRSTAAVHPAPVSSASRRAASRSFHPAFIGLAMAASFLITLAVAWSLRGPGQPAGDASSAPIAATETDGDEVIVAKQLREQPDAVIDAPAGDALAGDIPPQVDGPEDEDTIDVPLYRVDRDGDAWASLLEPVLPRHIRESLERSGHRVRTHQQLVPVDLPDGRRIIFPIEEIELIEDAAYQ